MEKDEANERFQEADACFRDGAYDDALEILGGLEAQYPNNRRLLNAKARSLAALRRDAEALEICDHLLSVHDYEKIRPLRDNLAARLAPAAMTVRNEPEAEAIAAEVMSDPDTVDEGSGRVASSLRIKPFRLLILILLCLGMWRGYVPYWLGGGIIVAYFVAKMVIRAALYRLFTIPFKMKGRALEGATATIHSVTIAEPPPAGEEDDEEGPQPTRYVWVDVTITPPAQSRGFTHWEPGELAVAPASLKLKKLDDHEKCSTVLDVTFVNGEEEQEDEGYKLVGPQRLRVRVGLPGKDGERRFKFVYYFEVFGEFESPA